MEPQIKNGDTLAVLDARRPDAEAVRDQLERVLAGIPFRNSKRDALFLRYVVSETLEGRAGSLKERRIGTEVFDRPPSYDTSGDPIVRQTAGEVRKRLAQYYQESRTRMEVRIELPPGHYVPEFRLPELRMEEGHQEIAPLTTVAPTSVSENTIGNAIWQQGRFLVSLLIVALALTICAIYVYHIRPDAMAAFWTPFIDGTEPVTVAIGQTMNGVLPNWPVVEENSRLFQIGFADSVVEAQVVWMLGSHKKEYGVRASGSMTLQDLKKGPIVLIGALNNVWTMRLQDQLPYALEQGDMFSIRDRRNHGIPFQTGWCGPHQETCVDYAIVARFIESRTKQPVLMLAGFSGAGTRAAGEFIAQRMYLEQLAARAPAGWWRKNMEIVLAVDEVRGYIGTSRIAASHFW